MTLRAERAPVSTEKEIEFIPLKEYPGLKRTIKFVDEATRRRLEGRIEVPKLTSRDVRIVSRDDFFQLQREFLFSRLHKDADYFYSLLDKAYGERFPLILESGFLIDPETKIIIASRSHADEIRKVEKGKTGFLLNYGSLLCCENLRRMAPTHNSEEPLLAFFGLESLANYILTVADFIQKTSPKEAKKVRSQAEKLKARFDKVLTEAQWGRLRIKIEGAKIAVFLKGKLLLQTGFWLDRQVAEIVSHKIWLTFVQLAGLDKKAARSYVDRFEAKRKYVGQEFGLPLEETKKNLRQLGLGTGKKLFDAYLNGEIPLTFAQNLHFYHHPEFFI